MRFLLLIALPLVLFASCELTEARGAHGRIFKTALSYNDYIIDVQKDIVNHYALYADVVEEDRDSAYQLLQEGEQRCAKFLSELSLLTDFRGDSSFKNAVIALLTFYQKGFHNEYRTLNELSLKEDLSAEEWSQLSQLSEQLADEETELTKRVVNAQDDFARKFNLRLESWD